MTCLFCRIIAREIPADIVFEDDHVVAFRDVRPQAPTHVLVIPREHIASLADVTEAHAALLGHILHGAARVARQLGVSDEGYRTVINTGSNAGQTVFHIHVHVLAGRALAWPPG